MYQTNNNAKSCGMWEGDKEMWKRARMELIKYKPETLGDDYLELLQEIDMAKEGSKNSYVLITLNFKPDANVIELQDKLMDRVVAKKWIKDWIYSWEFYNKEGEWTHPHIHMLTTKSGKGKAQILRELASTCKEYIKPNEIDVKIIQAKDFQKVVDYITKDRLKDVEHRKKLGLRALYRL